MRVDFLDRYSRDRHSLAHRWPARVKLLGVVVAVLSIALTPPTLYPISPSIPLSWVHIIAGLTVVCLIQLARIPWRYVAARLAVVAPLLLLLGLSIPLSQGLRQGGWLMLTVVVKGCLSFCLLVWLTNTTPFDHLLRAMRQLGVPKLFISTLSFMYRYVFVLFDEFNRMRRARQARTFVRRRLPEPRASAQLLGMVLLRALDRAERVHAAMLARGLDREG
jgi:cobalt/nickel transport system permease protein